MNYEIFIFFPLKAGLILSRCKDVIRPAVPAVVL